MQTEDVKYSGCLIHPIVTTAERGRYTAAGNITDRDGETRTLGVDGDFPTLGKPEIRQLNWRLHGSSNAALYLTTTFAGGKARSSE